MDSLFGLNGFRTVRFLNGTVLEQYDQMDACVK